jgi:hypothetical protein
MAAGTSSRNPEVPIPFDACDPSGTFVFVSYAHDDKTLAYPELQRIRSLGIRVWYDDASNRAANGRRLSPTRFTGPPRSW